MSLNALYVDFNSYFASVEQQLDPKLRHTPVAVLPVMAETTCCIAASYEAKAFGIKTGTMVREARKLCKDIIFVEARPQVYVEHHHKLIDIVESCTHVEKVLSIDEMVCKLTGSQQNQQKALLLAAKIKDSIRKTYDYIQCSIGIAPNTFLAKVASNMQKPDGCTVLTIHDIPEKLLPLKLRDLNGIGKNMEKRLNQYGIKTIESLYKANKQQLSTAWGSIEGERLYDKLRGLEPHYTQNKRSSLGHSHVLPPEQRSIHGAKAVLHKLLQKAGVRLRSYQLLTTHVSIKIKFKDKTRYQQESKISPTDHIIYLTEALEQLLASLVHHRDETPVAVSVQLSGLTNRSETSHDLFEIKSEAQSKKLNTTLDHLNLKYGKNTVYLGGAHDALQDAPMRIAFQHIPDLELENDD